MISRIRLWSPIPIALASGLLATVCLAGPGCRVAGAERSDAPAALRWGFAALCPRHPADTPRPAEKYPVLENDRLALSFDRGAGKMTALRNKLTGETYRLDDDGWAVEAVEFRIDSSTARLESRACQGNAFRARYKAGGAAVEVTYSLGPSRHFAEKQVTLTCSHSFGLKHVVLSRPSFSGSDLRIVPYRYPKFERRPGSEPTVTYFGRTPKGGFFAGVEVPFDASSSKGNQLVLGYAPSLKVAAGERLVCEPVYFGVYRRNPSDREESGLPLSSESEAMVAMTSAILGPPRHGLVPMACGWHCEMQQHTYASEADVEADMKSLDFVAECGIDWISDSHPWGGETEKMNALVDDRSYTIGPLVRKFLEHSQKVGVKVVMWPSMNNTHPWSPLGRPFRADKPEWLLKVANPANKPQIIRAAKGNCLANRPFFDWLLRVNAAGLASGYYPSWAMDGSFFGDGGWFTSIIPVDCASERHDHLPGDSNYACQRALAQWIAEVRRQYPREYIFMCRPPMDLGVWSLRNVDACFTLLETGTGSSNLAAGDAIRTWSRTRLHRDFFPHYLDQPLLFPSRSNRKAPPNWPQGKLDYILLSALSSSPNQLYYLPTKTGIPAADKAEIRKWLDWGRKSIAYLQVRKDLPDWPAAGKVDGSAHLCGDRGLVFLFNPGKEARDAHFELTEDSIGLRAEGTFQIRQIHPPTDRSLQLARGKPVAWPVPGETAVVLEVHPMPTTRE